MASITITDSKRKILAALKGGPRHGYNLSKEEKIPLTSVYEHLRDLRKNGFIEARGEGRRKVYNLTEKGRYLLKALE